MKNLVIRFAPWLAWGSVVASIAGIGGGLVFLVRSWNVPTGPRLSFPAEFWVAVSVGILAFPAIGALVASRRPRNSIGWAFCLAGVLFGLDLLAFRYGIYEVFVRGEPRALAFVSLWLFESLWVPAIFLVSGYLFLYFPDGRLPSPGWRPLAWPVALETAVLTAGIALRPGPFEDFPSLANPYGVAALDPFATWVIRPLEYAGFPLTAHACVTALVVRFRRARGIERQQLKWFVYSSALFALILLPASLLSFREVEWLTSIIGLLFLIPFVAMPLAVGIAILRHHLFDIDVLINRTAVYAVLSAVLVAIYALSIVVLQVVFRPLTQGSEIAVAASTLLVAALFQPARQRIQRAADRRLYRRKYDAAKTVANFSARLRQQVDLGVLEKELLGVVRETMQPAHASPWLREAAR